VNEFMAQFLLESREYVEQATTDLIALEKRPGDKERLDSAFRAFHTLKGGAGIVDFDAMHSAVHAAEDVLSAVRSGTRPVTGELISDCLACIDQVGRWLDAIERVGDLPPHTEPEAGIIVERFRRSAGEQPVAKSSGTVAGLPEARELLEAQIALLDASIEPGLMGRIASAGIVAANVLRSTGRADAAEDLTRATEASVAGKLPGLLRDAIEAVLEPALPPDVEAEALSPAAPDAAQPQQGRVRTLRIDASRVDGLVALTSELTVAKNAIGHAVELSQRGDPEAATHLARRYARLDRLVGELQRSVVGLRVLPLRHVFQRFPRLLREISADLGKPVELVVEGGETEADKAIVEMLFEPLLHVVRNAIDHGIEPASVRQARGKRPVATLSLSAQRQGEHVVVEARDDGEGIDVAKVRQVALERGLVSEDALRAMADETVVDLIFEAGFSTASAVTGMSGRGVGMDAVRRSVDRFGGHVTVKTDAGAGTTVRFTLPFSVIMTRVMLVGAGEQLFGIPLDAVVETVRVSSDKIARIGSALAVVLRDRTLPLVELAAALDLLTNVQPAGEATLVITRIDGHYGALRVDRIGARLDVMLKPLEGLLAGTRGIGGSTVLGDGSVLLVLNPGDLFHEGRYE
jgi:two-component system chemotaxis sensor kinase CheA